MSSGTAKKTKRPYRKRRRAELEQQTRLRITEAAVALHGSLGPANTTISAVADRAGVQRATVYRHFPDEAALFDACSSHWAAQHPLPDPAAWTEIADFEKRMRTALAELYSWFARGEQMLEKIARDAALVPAMRGPGERAAAWFTVAAKAVLEGHPARGRARKRLQAAIGHALSFSTWRSLVRAQGLSDAEAVELMVGLAASAARG